MASGEHTREYLTVKTNITDIVNILVAQVDPRLFAQKLNEAHLVSSYVVQKVSVRDIPPANRVQYIIQAVLSQISLDSTKYHVFIEVLRMEQSLRTLADKLTQYYGKLILSRLQDFRVISSGLCQLQDKHFDLRFAMKPRRAEDVLVCPMLATSVF